MNTRILAIASAALLLGASLTTAHALEVNVGGNAVTATVGGGGGNVATVGVGESAKVSVSTNDGPLLDVGSEGDTTTGTANLGTGGLGIDGILDGIDLGDVDILPPDGDGSGAAPPTQIAAAFTSLSSSDQQALKIRCRNVLMEPQNYDAQALQLCRLLIRIGQ